jgi:hypothetical protein
MADMAAIEDRAFEGCHCSGNIERWRYLASPAGIEQEPPKVFAPGVRKLISQRDEGWINARPLGERTDDETQVSIQQGTPKRAKVRYEICAKVAGRHGCADRAEGHDVLQQ